MVTVNETNREPDGTFETLEAETLLGADVANASENQILVTQGDGTLAAETQAQGPNPYDQAQSFAESDVTVTTTNIDIVNGSLKISDITEGATGSTVIQPDADFSNSATATHGVAINPNSDLYSITVNNYADVSGATRALLTDEQRNLITSESLSSGSATLTPTNGLQSSTKYYAGIDADGDSHTRAGNTSASFPYTSTDIDITAGNGGILAGNSDLSSTTYSFKSIETTLAEEGTSGSATIEWDGGIPTDIFEWDVATFTRTLDNETVDVFVAYSSDGGSTWTRTNSGNPITRNYSLNEDTNITADVDVRIETELSRADTTNNPTLDSCYRSWLV